MQLFFHYRLKYVCMYVRQISGHNRNASCDSEMQRIWKTTYLNGSFWIDYIHCMFPCLTACPSVSLFALAEICFFYELLGYLSEKEDFIDL